MTGGGEHKESKHMKRLLILSLSALACGMSAQLSAPPVAIAAPAPQPVQYYQAIGDVKIRDTPNGIVIGALLAGDTAKSLGEVEAVDGVDWCQHEFGWSACAWLRVYAPVRGAYQIESV
jgi:hypothetical protein